MTTVPLTFLVASLRAELIDARNAVQRSRWQAQFPNRTTPATTAAIKALNRAEQLCDEIEKQHAGAPAEGAAE